MCPTQLDSKSPDCERGADVISCSWGSDNDHDPYLEQYITAWTKADMIPVFAVGNSGPHCKTSVSPADYNGVIGVGATDKHDEVVGFSSRGPSASDQTSKAYNPLTPSIVAPGLSIYGPSSHSDDGYSGFSGTSQSCPHIAGTAALILSSNSKLSNKDISNIIYNSADQGIKKPTTGSTSCGNVEWDNFPNYIYGYGRVDAFAAVTSSLERLKKNDKSNFVNYDNFVVS